MIFLSKRSLFPNRVTDSFDCESLKIDSVLFEEIMEDDFKSLLQKPSLKCLYLLDCLQVDLFYFSNAPTELNDTKFRIRFGEDDL